LPLCGAALTFFAAAKKVSKESGLTPPAFRWLLRFAERSGTPDIRVLAHSTFVTRQSFFRRRFARRSGRSQNHRSFGRVAGRESSRGFCGFPRREPSRHLTLFCVPPPPRPKCSIGTQALKVSARAKRSPPDGASPRRSRWPHRAKTQASGVSEPFRRARSARREA